jgi:hypothetical protein
MSACYLANSASLAKAKSIAWECMDTQTDIEACGGCQFPQIGEAEGADCTEMEGVDEVAVSLSARLSQVQLLMCLVVRF